MTALAVIMAVLTVTVLVFEVFSSFAHPTSNKSTAVEVISAIKFIIFAVIAFESFTSFVMSLVCLFISGYLAKGSQTQKYKIGYIWASSGTAPNRNIVQDILMHVVPMHLVLAVPSVLVLLNLI